MTKAVRGAIQVGENTAPRIERAATRLVREVLRENSIAENHLVSILFSVTDDLDAANPATGLRREGFASTPLFCAQEPRLAGGMRSVLRVLVTWRSFRRRAPVPVYLDGAEALRPDLGPGDPPGSRRSRRRGGFPVSGELTVWHVTREYAGLAEAGGVKDVVRGLAEAQARAGWRPTVVLPCYGFLPDGFRAGPTVAAFTLSLPDQDRDNALFDESVKVIESEAAGVRILLVDSPRFAAARDVYTYTVRDEEENHWKTRGSGHWDAHQKNVALQRAALETALVLGESPDVYHCHDGHTAFLPALAREDRRYVAALAKTRAVVTIHNAGAGYHQEVWSRDFARLLTGLPEPVIDRGMLGSVVDPLLLAGDYAALVTVSERYAEEINAEREGEFAGGLGRALRGRGLNLRGITNGIDPRPWDPRSAGAAGLPFTFDPSRGDLEGKRRCREALLRSLGLSDEGSAPLYAFVGRLTGQKGIDVLFHALRSILHEGRGGSRFVVMGRGEKNMESMLGWLAAEPASAGRLAFIPRYDNELASLVYSSSDFFLVPSAYEPCGLTDFIAQVRGSIPVVHRVGGLVKVRDGETGFSYDEHSPGALARAIDRATLVYRDQPALLDRIRRRAFEEIFTHHTWDRVFADSYRPLYAAAVPGKAWTDRSA